MSPTAQAVHPIAAAGAAPSAAGGSSRKPRKVAAPHDWSIFIWIDQRCFGIPDRLEPRPAHVPGSTARPPPDRRAGPASRGSSSRAARPRASRRSRRWRRRPRPGRRPAGFKAKPSSHSFSSLPRFGIQSARASNLGGTVGSGSGSGSAAGSGAKPDTGSDTSATTVSPASAGTASGRRCRSGTRAVG